MRVVLICLFLLAPASAGAWEQAAPPWPATDVPYCVAVLAADAASEDERHAFRTAVSAAIAGWRADCSSFCARLEDCGPAPAWPGDWNDGANWIVWLADWDSLPIGGKTVGATAVWRRPDGTPIDADTWLNDEDFAWSVDGDAWAIDVESVVAHEIGHALGLAHYDETDMSKRLACLDDEMPSPSVMCSQLSHGAIRRQPTADDLEGLCALYPAGDVSACDASRTGAADAEPRAAPAGCSNDPFLAAPVYLVLSARMRRRRPRRRLGTRVALR